MHIAAYGGAAGATAASAGATAIANAIKASGAIIKVSPTDFDTILSKSENPLVVVAESKFFGTTFKYMTSYKGLCFYTKSLEPLQLPSKTELIAAKKIWIPG
ncbi:hypothetical protein AMJ86_08800 [bacterium SM23_57]|nr:MAG: hypothetical protein AMJ86_08800 [bacterium SM23_57]